jgi:hypothetical protein
MIAAPMLARTLPTISPRVLTLRATWAMLAIVIAVTMYRILDGLPARKAPDHAWLDRLDQANPGGFRFPIAAADFVDRSISPRSGKLINGFNYGGYLAWRLPRFRVMADPRTQLYSPDFWTRFFFSDPDTTRTALRELIAQHNPDAAILPRDDTHFRPHLIELGWQVVHEDDRAIVLKRAEVRGQRAGVSDQQSHLTFDICHLTLDIALQCDACKRSAADCSPASACCR